ncbi:hypothetical protein M9H77_17854 [Catharanthus roseus]|uniref:Uncharacterized protein n=1 Tax=Catharanthus roseus TaxID=4058 RepID=A0ACC0B5T4_CATRO|nr:hypothetical protein M9H77_17854 [Catharanthus roseus]
MGSEVETMKRNKTRMKMERKRRKLKPSTMPQHVPRMAGQPTINGRCQEYLGSCNPRPTMDDRPHLTVSGRKEISYKESITVRLRGVEYLITLDKLAEAHGIPNLGSKVAKKSDITNVKGYNELAFKREVLGNPKVKEFENVISSRMKLHSKVLHKLITNYISPKNNSYQYINATKLYIIRHIQKLRDLNLCYLLIENMMAAEKLGRTKALLYGIKYEDLKNDERDDSKGEKEETKDTESKDSSLEEEEKKSQAKRVKKTVKRNLSDQKTENEAEEQEYVVEESDRRKKKQ